MEQEIPEWVLGALICLFGSTLTALGLVLQKHAHTIIELAGEQAGGYFMQKWWILGFLIFISAQIINMAAMAMTPQVVLSCLGSWTLVCNAVFAHLILEESLTERQVVCVVGLVMGMAMVIYNSPRPSGEADPMAGNAVILAERFLSPEVGVMTTCFICLVCLLRALAVGLRLGVPGARHGTVAPGRRQLMASLSWAVMAAVAVGYTALLFKCIAEMIACAALASPPPWCCWEAYAIAAAALSCAPTELHCLNLALRSGEAVLVVPMYLTLGMVSQLTTGAVFFREFRDFSSAMHAAGFACGVALTLVLVAAMAAVPGDESSALEDLAPELLEKAEPDLDLASAFVQQRVSVAGFAGAIEVMEGSQWGRWRGRTEGSILDHKRVLRRAHTADL